MRSYERFYCLNILFDFILQDKIILKEHIIPIMKNNSADNVSAVYASSINPGFFDRRSAWAPCFLYGMCVEKVFISHKPKIASTYTYLNTFKFSGSKPNNAPT